MALHAVSNSPDFGILCTLSLNEFQNRNIIVSNITVYQNLAKNFC